MLPTVAELKTTLVVFPYLTSLTVIVASMALASAAFMVMRAASADQDGAALRVICVSISLFSSVICNLIMLL